MDTIILLYRILSTSVTWNRKIREEDLENILILGLCFYIKSLMSVKLMNTIKGIYLEYPIYRG